jgi:hypothetical protein
VDRRKFIGGIAVGNLLATPFATALAQTVKGKAPADTPTRKAAIASLAAGTSRNIGSYASIEIGGRNITDYSGITYDPVGRRMCLFGGGHGPSQQTDIRVLDLSTMQWSSLYPTTPRSQMTVANGDSDLGRWISTNQPYARHSYNMSLVAGRRFYLFTVYGQADHLDGPGPAYGGRVCWYDFDTQNWNYSAYANGQTPWAYYAAAVFDPISGKILIAGYNQRFGPGSVWVYDPAHNSYTTGAAFPAAVGYAHDIVYYPPDDSFYVFQSDGRVWRMVHNRANAMFTQIAALTVSGTRPAAGSRCGFAYDPVNRIIGGNVTNGTFYAFDPGTSAWSATSMQVETGSIGMPNQAFHCLDYDAASGCFVFLNDASNPSTWVYRHGGKSTGTGASVGDLDIALDFGGGSVAVFAGANAVDQGDFVGEFVRQKCYVAKNPAFPDWRVYFRVDADTNGKRIEGAGARDEVIVEYGRATAGTPTHVQVAYTATINKVGTAIATYAVPKHWWYARWRYQSAERPVVRTPAMLKARGWLPNFGATGLFGLQANTRAVAWDGPMSAPAGFSNAMGGTGDNHQIGLLTEYAADYALFESPASLVSLRTEGEWCGNWCMHIRDEATGAVLDVRNNKLRYKADGGTINNAPGANPASNPRYVDVETAHFYPCANMPWLLTEDPYYLEELQFGANWQLLFNQYHRSQQNLQGLVYPGQTRSFAWGLRDLFLLAASCPTTVPAWLRPKSYWRSCVADNRAYAMKFVNSPARIHALFKTWTRSDADPAWQTAWLNTVVGIGVGQGFEDWLPVFRWGIDKHIQQTNGTSGWPRQWPVPYYSIPNKAAVWGTPTGVFATTSIDATTCTTWADYWAYYKAGSPDAGGVGHSDTGGSKVDDTGWDGHTIKQVQSSPSYFLHLRAALAIAVTRGIPEAKACYDYLQAELDAEVMPRYRARGQARFAIDPGAAIVARGLANYQGLWWNDPAGSESGWGINFAHQGDVIFATWFTYDQAGKAWWLSLTADKVAESTYSGELYRTTGPAFNAVPFDPNLVSAMSVGSATLSFEGADSGTFSYAIGGVRQAKAITRQVFADPTPMCEYGVSSPPMPTANYQDLWWADPPGSESGWGINLTHQGDVIFATWFTYAFDGAPQWLVATTVKAEEGIYRGTIYRTSGPPFDVLPFDPDAVTRQPVGSMTLSFLNSGAATFEYTLDGIAQAKRITRQVFRAPGTVCQ